MARIPSQSSINAQLRAAQRRAETQTRSELRKFERDLKTAEQKANNEARRDLEKWQRDTNRKLKARRPSVTYTATETRYLRHVREEAEAQEARHPELHDVFLCHAWPDRNGPARELHDHLESFGVDVWFSEEEVALGTSLMREIDRGLRNSRIGLVLVTPALLGSLENEGVADRELSALLATERVIPLVHDTDFEMLRDHSPLLASRAGLSTEGSTLREVAVKVAETVKPVRED